MNKDVLDTAIEAWRDLRVTLIDLPNISYRFIAHKQYVWWSYGNLGKKKCKHLPSCVI